jgi:hypothetical protein
MRESTCNPFLESSRLNKLKNIALRNVSENYDGRKCLDMMGIKSIPEKAQKLRFSGRKVAVGESIIFKVKVKNLLFVSPKLRLTLILILD